MNSERAEDQPEVLPEIIASFVGRPGSIPLIGGRWSFDASFLGLRREGDEQDVNRASLDFGWQRRLVSNIGLVTTMDLSARGDFYSVRDRDPRFINPNEDDDYESRLFPQAHIETSYPFVRPFNRFQAMIEPKVALTVANNVDNNSEIPNEDSRDVQIDSKNLFSPNRFPGLDRVEDKNRVTYGVKTGVYGYEGSSGTVFFGQSYRLDEDDNPFPDGSGLSNQESDFVGEINADYQRDYNLNYRFQLAGDDLTSERHEVDASANFGRLQLGSTYLFAKALDGTDIDESREQIRGDVGFYFTPEWRMSTGAIQDLGAEPGLRQAYFGLQYFGQCLSWALTAERNLTEDSAGDSETEILFRIGLKNLSDFATSGYNPRQGE